MKLTLSSFVLGPLWTDAGDARQADAIPGPVQLSQEVTIMRHIGLTGLLLGAVLALSGLATSAASATCYAVPVFLYGIFGNWTTYPGCTGSSISGSYILATPTIEVRTPYIWCAKLNAGEKVAGRMYYMANTCAGVKEVAGEYLVIYRLGPILATDLSGENYPIITEGSASSTKEGEIAFKTKASELPAEAISVLLTVSELSLSGTMKLTYSGVHEDKSPTQKCSTEGAAAGVVLVNGESQLVYTNSELSAVAALITFPSPLSITCEGKLKVKVQPPLLVKVKAPTEADIDKFELISACSSAGVQEESAYWVEGEEFNAQLLKLNFGVGNEDGCQEVKPTITMSGSSSSTAKMFTIL
jgi:hypothetical protein